METNSIDAAAWLENTCTPEQLEQIKQFGLNEVGFETYIAALMADFANSLNK